jgi:hypothetical protein
MNEGPAQAREEAEALGRPCWSGAPGRLEVWYATFTDPDTGEGFWLHHEVLVRLDGTAEAHGWLAVFPPGQSPVVERFGPQTVASPAPEGPEAWFEASDVLVGRGVMRGRTAGLAWDLRYTDASSPLYTFPAYAWHRRLLPSAQVVPWPSMELSGTVTVDERTVRLDRARGGFARIYGHGNAHRWGWLHADLGDGDVLEVVAAQGRRPLLRAVPPKVFAQLRVGGVDWPEDPLLAAATTRARLGLPRWYATVTTPTRRLRLGVRIPPVAAVTLEYRDPDDTLAYCTNSCVADAEIRLERRLRSGWELERRWSLRGTAHAEIGERP